MESKLSTQIKVGIFLTAGVIATLISIFFLGADKALFSTYIRLHAQFEQVQGLAEGSVVSLSGVTVGNVEKIDFANQTEGSENHINQLVVTMRIDEKYLPRIRKGSEVDIRTQGALGDKFIYITPAALHNEMVQDGEMLAVAKPTDIISVLSEKGKEAGKIFDVIDELAKTTKAINQNQRMEKIMANMESMAEKMNRTSTSTELMINSIADKKPGERISTSLDRLESILGKIDRGQGSFGAFINDPSIHDRLKALLGGSSRKANVENLLRTSVEAESK